MVQAALLISVYEYVEGWVDEALTTVTACARMGYTARIHLPELGRDGSERQLEQTAEATNTWWGIIICERYIPSIGIVFITLETNILPSGPSLVKSTAQTNHFCPQHL